MKTVSLQSQKGGAGKTTICIGLAVAAELAGLSAVIIDIDPQSSAAAWADLRQSNQPAIATVPPSRLAQALRTAESAGADITFIDTAPHAGTEAHAAARAANLILIPCRPALLDIKAIGATADIARAAGKPAYVVLNASPPMSPRIAEDARQAISAHGLAVAPVILAQRAAFTHALTAGLSAQEFDVNSKAADELERLYRWLSVRLKPSRRHNVKTP